MSPFESQADSRPNLYRGTFHPYHPKRAAPAAYERYVLIGAQGNVASKFIVRLRAPTYEYPTVGLFVQLGNGKSTTFVRLSLDELGKLAASLAEWLPEIVPLHKQLSLQAETITKSLDAVESYRRVMEAVQNEPDSFVSDDDGPEIGPSDLTAIDQVTAPPIKRRNGHRQL